MGFFLFYVILSFIYKRKGDTIMYYTWNELFWIFFTYSFVGWCAGVIANALRRRKFVNTGVLNLPLCPIYGIIGIAYGIFLPELKKNLFFLFLGGCVIAFIIIWITGFLLEQIFNRKWWDYSKSRFQFQGYLNLLHLLIFGTLAVVCIRYINPLLCRLTEMIPETVHFVLEITLGVILLIDFICCIAALFQLQHSIRAAHFVAQIQDFTDDIGNALTRAVTHRMEKAYPNIERNTVFHTQAKEKHRETFAFGCCAYKLIWLFFLGAFLGDITETIFCRITAGVWMSRSSVVYGPFSIVWGLGCAFLTALLYKYRDKSDRYIFVYGTILGGAYEYICSVFTELVFGTVFWDYSKIPFNLGGRINLLFCFFWGIAAVVWLKILYPIFSGWIEKIPVKIGKTITPIAVVLMILNILISGMALARYSDRVMHPKPHNQVEQFLDGHFDNDRIERIYPNAKIVK